MSIPLTNFRPSWVNSSLPHVGEKVTLISIESFRKKVSVYMKMYFDRMISPQKRAIIKILNQEKRARVGFISKKTFIGHYRFNNQT